MDQKARRIFIATALGTMTGLYASIALFPYFAWWIGALTGGVTAGFIYSLPDIIRYSPAAFAIAKKDLEMTAGFPFNVYQYIRGMTIVEKLYVLLYAIGIAIFASWAFLLFSFPPHIGMTIIMLGIFPIFYCAAIIMTTTSVFYEKESEEKKVKRLKKAIFLITPPGFLFSLFWLIKRFAPLLAVKIFMIFAELLRFLITFIKTLFLFVQSRDLVLCAIDAGLGVLISYTLFVTASNLQIGPTLVFGGLIGGLLGVLHYEIISVRMLRVAP